MKQKILKRITVLAAGTGVFLAPAVSMNYPAASENVQNVEMGTAEIKVEYSDDIQPGQDDRFVITYASEDNPEGTAAITVNGYAYANNFMEEKIPSGTYTILDIGYLGSNEAIIEQGYSVSIGFYCTPDIPGSITIGIGKQKIASLAESYGEGRLRIKDKDHSETGEASKDGYGENYAAKGTPDTEVEPDKMYTVEGESSTDTETDTGADMETGENTEGDGTGDAVVENTETGDEGIKPAEPQDEKYADNYGEVDAPVTDKGEGNTILYEDEKDEGESKENDKEQNENKKPSNLPAKFIGLMLISATGFSAIFILHKAGKV